MLRDSLIIKEYGWPAEFRRKDWIKDRDGIFELVRKREWRTAVTWKCGEDTLEKT